MKGSGVVFLIVLYLVIYISDLIFTVVNLACYYFWNMEFLLGTFYFNQPMKKVVHLPHPSIQKQNVVVPSVPKTKICHYCLLMR
jgi:hypothetical protein